MSTRFYLYLVGLCGLAPAVAAQTATAANKSGKDAAVEAAIVNKMRDVNDKGENGFDILAFDTRPRLVRGTPFVLPGWANGTVLIGTSTKPVGTKLKFDAYSQQLRAMRAGGDSIIIAPETVQAFTLYPAGANAAERRFERLPRTLAPDMPAAFAESLSAGEAVRLLRFQQKVILKGQQDPSYSSGAAVDAFQSRSQYFLRWADGTYTPVKPNRASVLAAVAARQPTAVATEMQDKTKVRTDADLGTLVQRINEQLKTK